MVSIENNGKDVTVTIAFPGPDVSKYEDTDAQRTLLEWARNELDRATAGIGIDLEAERAKAHSEIDAKYDSIVLQTPDAKRLSKSDLATEAVAADEIVNP